MTGVPMPVRLIGDVRVGAGETELVLARMPATLLCLLVAANGDTVDREELIVDLWDGEPPPSAAGALRVHVSSIRRALASVGLHDRLTTRANGWSLRLMPEELDIGHADWLVEMAEEARRRADLRAAATSARSAVDILTGTPMATAIGLPALSELAGRIARIADRAEDVLVDTQLDLGNGAAVVERALRRSTDHPTDELAVIRTARALGQSGNVAAAIEECHRHVEALLERGLSPSESFRAIELALLRDDVERPSGAALAPSFVGRDDELDWLTAAHRDMSDVPMVLLLEAAPGMGKTRLALEFQRRRMPLTTRVLWGSCSPERSVAFEPFLDILHGTHTDWLDPMGEVDDLRLHELAIFQSLGEAVMAAVGDGGVLVIDDAHWMDPGSLSVLRRIVRSVETSCMVVLLARTTEPDADVEAFVSELEHAGRARRRTMRGLDEVAVKQLAAADGFSLDGPLGVSDLAALSGGNPLFVRTLLRAGGRGGVDGQRDIGRIVHELVRARLGAMPAGHAATLVAAAVVGAYFQLAVVAEVRDIELGEVLDAVELGSSRELIAATERYDEFAFEHALFRDAVLASVTPARRALLHRAAAWVVAGREGDTPAVVHHLVAAGDLVEPGVLRRAALNASVTAVSAGTYAIAGEMAAIAAPFVEPGSADDAQLAAVIGAAALGAGDVATANECWQRALKGAIALGLDALTARILAWQSTVGRVSADHDTLQMFRDLCDRLRAAGNVRALASVLDTLATYLRLGPHREEARAVAMELAEIGEREQDPLLQSLACRSLHHALFVEAAPVAERQAVTARTRHFADRSRDPFSLALAHLHSINDLLTAGDPDGARAAHERMRHQVSIVPFPLGTFLVEAVGAAFRLLADELDGLDDELLRIAALGRELHVAAADFTLAGQLFVLRWAQGRLGEVAGLLELVGAANPSVPIWQHARALALCAGGDHDGARVVFDAAFDATADEPRRDWLWLPEAAIAAEVCALIGDDVQCRRLSTTLEPFADLDVVIAEGSVVSLGPLARPLAVLFGRIGESERAHRWAMLAAARSSSPSAALWRRVGTRHQP